jgi:hypothetical protein
VNIDLKANIDLAGIRIPDSKLAREIMELGRDTESPLLFHHSSRVYYWGALAGKRRGLRFDPELLYAGAMFHDMGSTHRPPAPGVVSITSAAIRAVAGRGPLGPMKKYWSLLNVG